MSKDYKRLEDNMLVVRYVGRACGFDGFPDEEARRVEGVRLIPAV
jgi:hypothetical protein